jgi:hypothetical protein
MLGGRRHPKPDGAGGGVMRQQPRARVAAACVAALAVGFAAVNVVGAVRYGIASLGNPARAALVEVPGASERHVVSHLAALQRATRPGTVVSDALWLPVGKLEQAYSAPTPIVFYNEMTGPYRHDDTVVAARIRGPLGAFSLGSIAYRSRLRALILQHNAFYRFTDFPGAFGEPYDRFLFDTRISRLMRTPSDLWLLRSPNPMLLNTRRAGPSYDVQLTPWRSVRDHLVLLSSQRGSPGIVGGPRKKSPAYMIARSEPDPLIRGGQIEAVGRSLLFAVVNPSPTIRLAIDFTATLNADGNNRIPPVSVLGTRRTAFDVAGRGAARMISPPFSPRLVHGVPMLALDMGSDGIRFKDRRRGLLALFGSQYGLDPRLLVGFVRDISVISEGEYRALRPPTGIARFPSDLRNHALEFSGIYEDGWASEHVVAWLIAPKGARRLTLRGTIPDVDGTASEIAVAVDGITRASQPLLPGDFELRSDVRGDGRRHKVELIASRGLRLPNGDDRLVSARLAYLGFE